MQLRAGVYYLQAYQIHSEKWNTRIQGFLAITSSASIGGWAIGDEYSMIWGFVIAASQVVNVIKGFLPFQKRAKDIGSLNIEQEKLALQEDRNIPTIKVNVPMPKGAKPPKKGQNTNSSPTQSTKRS